MIWESVYLMTAFDLVIVGGAVFALYVFFRSFRVIAQFRSNSAVFAITAGIVCIGAIYFVDLLSMHVFPLFLSATQSMTIMRNLHFNISWIATAFAIGLLVFGFWRLMRNASLFVTTLGRDERDVAGKLEIYRGIENELRATRDRYREAVSARSDWIWETGKDGRLVSISERFYEVTGYRSEDFIGRRFGEAPHWRGNEEVAKFVRAKLRKREAFESIRFESVGPAGESHFLELDGKPVFDEAGAFEGFRGTGRDVTEVERTKEILGLLGQTLDDAVGEEFVQKLVENLAMVLDADYAFIGELAGEDDDQIRSTAVYAHV